MLELLYLQSNESEFHFYLIIQDGGVFRANHLNELLPVDVRPVGLLVEVSHVQDVAHPDAGDRHAL